MTDIKINTTIKILPSNFLDFKLYKQFPIPTEMIITNVGLYYPRVGTSYLTELYIHDNKILSYDELYENVGTTKFKGCGCYDELLLIECWEDWGDDGHIEYSRRGWKYVSKREFNKIYNQLESLNFKQYCQE